MSSDERQSDIERLLDTNDLAAALESDRFKEFLDRMPIAVAVSELGPEERIIYANDEFARLTDQANSEILGNGWDRLPGRATSPEIRAIGEVVAEGRDYIGSFTFRHGDSEFVADAWSNVIDDDSGAPAFRLVALAEAAPRETSVLDELEERVREKDMQLRELQHRVKNNLQMITALIRIEAKGVVDRSTSEGFDRLAGRVEALGLLYRALTETGSGDVVELGVYLSEIASAVMHAHAMEGIRLDLQVDTWPVSIDVAMPTGLVVNELLTNALKHAFVAREAGTITLRCTVDDQRCTVLVADDGVGSPAGASWPRPGKLSSLIVRSLVKNANAHLDFQSAPGKGTRVTITFLRADAAPAG
ncbi:MAG: sensor histidine kinase [Caulobacteraceae bacterium]